MASRTHGTASAVAHKSTAQKARQRPSRRHARRVTRRNARQNRAIWMIAAAILLLVATVSVWKVGSQAGATDGQALYQFDTQDFHSLAFDPENPDRIYFGHHYGLKVSDDAGKSWNDTTMSGVDAMQLAIPTADPQRRYVAGHEIFYTSVDGGQTWRSQPNNLPGLDLHTFAASASDPMRVYAIPLGFGFFSSADGGETWNQATLPPEGDRAHVALAVSPSDPDHLFAGLKSRIFESHDAGNTWTELSATAEGIIVALTVSESAGETTLYAGTSQGLFRSQTGTDWERLPLVTEGAVLAVATTGQSANRIAVIDQQGHFYRSDDGGSTWSN